MSNDMLNTPMPPGPEPKPAPMMFQTWVNAVTKPSEATYAEIARSPYAKYTTAFLWVFIASLIQFFLSFLVGGSAFRQMLQQRGFGNGLPDTGGLAGRAITLICGAPITAVITVVLFAIVVALIQWVARMFGGRGTYDQLAYTFAAVLAPISIVSGVLALFGAIPYVGICFGILGVLLFLYGIVLQVMAAKGVHGFGWGAAAGSVLLPFLAVVLLCCCLIVGVSALIGVSLGNVFSQIGPLPIPTP